MLVLLSEVEDRIAGADQTTLLSILGTLHMLAMLVSRRIREMRCPRTLKEAPHDRVLTIREAVQEYRGIISRTFLYEHGTELGIVVRPPGRRKPVVVEHALREYLERGWTRTGTVPPRRGVVDHHQRERASVAAKYRRHRREPGEST